MSPRRAVLASVASIALFFLLLHTAVLPHGGFFSGDQSAKYLQTLAFARSGPIGASIDVASRDVDPEYRYQEPVLRNRGGRLVATFSWLLPILTAPFLALLGLRGVFVVPALSSIAIFLAARSLGRRLGLGDGLWSAWVVVLASPVLIYGSELWEHAPAAAFVMLAAVLFLPDERSSPRRLFTAGVCIGLGALFREEAAVALPALAVARAVSGTAVDRLRSGLQSAGLALAGAAAVFVATIPLNLAVYGSVLPLHLTSEIAKTGSYVEMRPIILSTLLLPSSYVAVFCLAAIVLLLCVLLRLRARDSAPDVRPDRVLLAAAVTAMAAIVTIGAVMPIWRLTVGGLSTFWSYRVDSVAHTWIFCAAAALVPWLGGAIRRDVARFLFVAAVLLMAGTIAIVPSPGGAQWSPRYLFPVAPLLAVLASAPAFRAGANDPSPLVAWTARAVLVCAAIMQVCGLGYVVEMKARNARITERLGFLASRQEVIITDVPWFPQVTTTLLPEYRILLAYSPAEVEQIADLAAARGHKSIAFVSCTPETGFTPPHNIVATSGGCRYERVARLPLGERVLIFDRYNCQRP